MPETLLVIVFLIALVVLKWITKKFRFAFSGRIAMAAMLITTGIAHFVFTEGMSLMLPDFVPYKTALVYFTGVVELAAAIGILIPQYRKPVGWLLIVFFIALIPANIYGALNHVDLEKASYNGNGPNYLWYRIPLQLFFMAWVYFSCLKPGWIEKPIYSQKQPPK